VGEIFLARNGRYSADLFERRAFDSQQIVLNEFSFTRSSLFCLFIVACEIGNLHWDLSNPFKKKISVQITVVLKCRTSGLREFTTSFPKPGHFIVRYDFGAKAVQFCRVILTFASIFGVSI